MEDNNGNWPTKEKTVKQQKLITSVLASSVFSKREFEYYMNLNHNRVKTSYDASVLIDMLLKTVRFRKRFNSPRQRAHLKCSKCGSTKDVTRYLGANTGKQVLYCLKCEEEIHEAREEAAAEAAAVPIVVSEKQEASADLYRKYEYENELQ